MALLINCAEHLAILNTARHEFQERDVSHADRQSFYEPRLRAVWERAVATTAYSHLGPFSLQGFHELPLTSKDALKQDPLAYTTVTLGEAHKYYETTGTSGRPTPTPRLVDDVVWNAVSVAEAWKEVLQSDDRVAILLPSDIVPVADLVASVCEYLGIAHVRGYPFTTGISDWDRLSSLWDKFKPTVCFLAPGVAMQVTRMAKGRGNFTDIAAPVRSFMLLGEVSTKPFRDRLATWWNARVYDASYGSTETGTLATTCIAGSQHLLPRAAYFEISDARGVHPIDGADEGRLVATPLHLHARPLLRIDTGDVVRVSSHCACANTSPTIEIAGRATEAVQVSGVALSVRNVEAVVYGAADATAYLLEVDPETDRARLLLERDLDSDRTTEPAIIDELQRLSQQQLGLRWHDIVFVNSLPTVTKSGASQKSWKRSNIRMVGAQR